MKEMLATEEDEPFICWKREGDNFFRFNILRPFKKLVKNFVGIESDLYFFKGFP